MAIGALHRRAARRRRRGGRAARRRSSASLPAAAAGVVTGIGVVRLRPVFVAVTTWILTWTVALFLLAFPSVLGRRAGHRRSVGALGRRRTTSSRWRCSSSRSCVAASFARGRVGIELRAARCGRPPPRRSACATARRRLGAFVAAAAVGGLAGGLAVQLAGVADAADYGP